MKDDTQYVPRSEARRILDSAGTRFFSCVFVKKDKTIRKMICRSGVRKYVKGVGMSYKPEDYNLKTIFDVQKHAYRHINLNTIAEAKIRGKRYVFVDL